MTENEHDQLIRLQERVKIFRDWLKNQYVNSEVDEYKVWEDIRNDALTKVEKHFDFVFGK